MSWTWVMTAIAMIGGVVAFVSHPKLSLVELSPRMTAWGWLLFGVGVFGYSVVAKSDTSGGLRELEMLWHIGLGVCGMLFAFFGFRRLRRKAEIGVGAVLGDRTRAAHRRAWILIGLGTAMLLGVMFVPGIQDRDMEASPESLALLAVILGGTGCVLTGGTTLRRLRKRQMKDAALPVAKK